MSVNLSMKQIIDRALSSKNKNGKSQPVTYSVVTTDQRDSPTVSTINIKLQRPIPESELNSTGILNQIANELGSENLGVIDALLAQYGLTDIPIGRKRTTGKVQVHLGDHLEQGNKIGIQSVKGKLLSQVNLRSLLEAIGKNYLIRDMKKSSAPLKFRTGRFANSMKVKSANIVDASAGKKPELNIFYSYMQYPYATFDPMKSSQPAMYNRPSYGARNPQVLIGSALAKAARDIIHTRYKIGVKEVRE